MGDTYFTLRFRTDSSSKTSHAKEHSFLFGFTCFRQRKDKSIKRGYFQQSVVLVTSLPYVGLFKQCVSIIATSYFKYGTSILRLVVEISQRGLLRSRIKK
eukprot:UN27758